MKNKIFFLLVALMLGFATVNAQSNNEKYDYAVIEFDSKVVCISSTNGEFEQRKVTKLSTVGSDRTEFLNIIKEMNDKGWQVVNVGTGPNYAMNLCFMQKKRTN
jgi:hypothetical protein